MVNWQQFKLSFVQASVFTPENSAFVAGRVVAAVLRNFGDRFDGEMQVLPIPPGVRLPLPPPSGLPLDIPHVVLKSSDGSSWQLTAGPVRFDCIRRSGTDNALGVGQAVEECVAVLGHYLHTTRTRAGRLGLVVQRVCPDEHPAQALISRFCNAESQNEPFNRSATFEIHNHKEYQPNYQGVNYRINSWVRCQCAAVGANKTPAIAVTQDLNTMASDDDRGGFNVEDVVEKTKDFYLMASNEAETIIKKYFPE